MWWMSIPKLRAFALLAIPVFVVSVLWCAPAQAKSSRKLSYSYEQIWPTAVRFLRIDEGLKILEKDVDTGYVLFELSDEGKRFRGSLELVRRKDDSKRDAVEVIVQISDRPSYMEVAILERMLKKVRVELGMPKEAPADPPADDSGDSGDEGDSGDTTGEEKPKASAP